MTLAVRRWPRSLAALFVALLVVSSCSTKTGPDLTQAQFEGLAKTKQWAGQAATYEPVEVAKLKAEWRKAECPALDTFAAQMKQAHDVTVPGVKAEDQQSTLVVLATSPAVHDFVAWLPSSDCSAFQGVRSGKTDGVPWAGTVDSTYVGYGNVLVIRLWAKGPGDGARYVKGVKQSLDAAVS